MPRIKIVPNETLSLASSLDSKASQLSSISSSASSAVTSLSYSIRSKAGIESKMGQARSLASKISGQISSMSGYVKTATNMLVEADKTNSINLSKLSRIYLRQYKTIPSANGNKNPGFFSSLISKMIGGAGIIGAAVSVVATANAIWADNYFFEPKLTGAESAAKMLNAEYKSFKGIYKWVKSNKNLEKINRISPEMANKITKARLLGLNDLYLGNASKASTWVNRFKNNFRQNISNKNIEGSLKQYTSGGAKAAWAWAGVGVIAVGNIVMNLDEAKQTNMSKTRFVGEVVLETSIDVGKTWVIGAAVAAGIAATGVAAPVIVVGAVSVVAAFGLDFFCKKITGAVIGTEKGLTETLSDIILDTGTTVINKSVKAISPVVIEVSNKMMRFT